MLLHAHAHTHAASTSHAHTHTRLSTHAHTQPAAAPPTTTTTNTLHHHTHTHTHTHTTPLSHTQHRSRQNTSKKRRLESEAAVEGSRIRSKSKRRRLRRSKADHGRLERRPAPTNEQLTTSPVQTETATKTVEHLQVAAVAPEPRSELCVTATAPAVVAPEPHSEQLATAPDDNRKYPIVRVRYWGTCADTRKAYYETWYESDPDTCRLTPRMDFNPSMFKLLREIKLKGHKAQPTTLGGRRRGMQEGDLGVRQGSGTGDYALPFSVIPQPNGLLVGLASVPALLPAIRFRAEDKHCVPYALFNALVSLGASVDELEAERRRVTPAFGQSGLGDLKQLAALSNGLWTLQKVKHVRDEADLVALGKKEGGVYLAMRGVHCVAVDGDRGLVLDCAEEWALPLSVEVLAACGIDAAVAWGPLYVRRLTGKCCNRRRAAAPGSLP
jgi:hypothetical protein